MSVRGNDTPAMAIEVFGAGHQIISNTIGMDVNGYELGVCGQALKLSGSEMDALDNVIVGASRFNPDDPNKTAIFTNDGSPLFDRVTVLRNIVRDGILPSTEDMYEFGPAMPDALKIFRSARITEIDGVNVSGGNGIDIIGGVHQCPHCRIDLYLDDADERNEALEWLGSANADLDGNFTFTMTEPLSPTYGIHTISTSTDKTIAVSNTVSYPDSVIFDYSAGMSYEASDLFMPIYDLEVTGPTTGDVGVTYQVVVTATPSVVTGPFTVTVELDGNDGPISETIVHEDPVVTLTYAWNTPGLKTIRFIVEGPLNTMEVTHQIMIGGGSTTPTPSPEPSGTPSGTTTPSPSETPSGTSTPQPGSTPTPTATPKPGTFGDGSDIYLPLVNR